jgi:hypothetical protein
MANLQAGALAEIIAGLQAQDVLLTDQPLLVRTLEEVYEPDGEQPANFLELSLRLEFEARFIASEDLRYLANSVLDANLPPGVRPTPGSLSLEVVSAPVLESQSEAHLEILARRDWLAQLPADRPAYLIAGLSPAHARQRLMQSLPVERLAEIDLHPSWWPRLPLVPFRIDVLSENPGG